MEIIEGKIIEIKGFIPRHEIVKKVVSIFIETEYARKGEGIKFIYPVEKLPNGLLFISRPGRKKNFDFKVNINEDFGMGKGSHEEVLNCLRFKKKENKTRITDLFKAATEVYNCSENDIDIILLHYPNIKKAFNSKPTIEVFLKVLKWLFIMEDVYYWDTEGRSFLFNFLKYVVEEENDDRLERMPKTAKDNPDVLKRHMKKCGIEWLKCKI